MFSGVHPYMHLKNQTNAHSHTCAHQGALHDVSLEEQLDLVEAKLIPRTIIRAKSNPSLERHDKVPPYISWAASSALAVKLQEAREILHDPDDNNQNLAGLLPESRAASPRKGPTTPPLLQRPVATDFDENPFYGSSAFSRNTFARRSGHVAGDAVPALRLGVVRKTRGKSKSKGKRSSDDMAVPKLHRANDLEDSTDMRKDALRRSVEAIESLSLALDSVNDEKNVLLRVLEACQTSESAAKQVSLHPKTIEGSSHLAKACFIAQVCVGCQIESGSVLHRAGVCSSVLHTAQTPSGVDSKAFQRIPLNF